MRIKIGRLLVFLSLVSSFGQDLQNQLIYHTRFSSKQLNSNYQIEETGLANQDDIDLITETLNQIDNLNDQLSKVKDLETKSKLEDLIEADKSLLANYYNSFKSSKTKTIIIDPIIDPDSTENLTMLIMAANAYFNKKGYTLASELLLHAFKNKDVDSQYSPINKDNITKSSVYQQIKNNNSLSGTSQFPKLSSQIDDDLYYSIHAFNYLKSRQGRIVNINDRYDYTIENNYPPNLEKSVVNWMAIAQGKGLITPFIINANFSDDSRPQADENFDVSIGYSRYKEFSFAIGKEEKRIFNIHFDHSGSKVIQTFGMLDTELQLFDSNNQLLTSSDDDGFGINSYLFFNVKENSNYKLVLKNHFDDAFGATKLLITNSLDDKRFDSLGIYNYNDIFNIKNENYTWNSYVNEHYSSLLKIIPPSSGRYQIDITSQFDNYLYLIDTRSAFPMRSSDFNDNGGGGTNARIVKDLSEGTHYLVVYCQENPASTFANYDEGDDLVFKLTKLS